MNPDCNAHPELCDPPTFCHLKGNSFNPVCQEEVNCFSNLGHKKCKYYSKCDLPAYADFEGCSDNENPCAFDASLCLTVCDHDNNADAFRCKIEYCDRFKNGEGCHKIKKCKIKRDCTGDNVFLDHNCCPSQLCDPVCIEDPSKCDPTPPEEECVWGY